VSIEKVRGMFVYCEQIGEAGKLLDRITF